MTLIFCWNSLAAQIIYPDNVLPTDTPKLFARGILSDGLSNRDFAISPTGDEIFFTIQQPRFALSAILHLIKTDGQWGKPEVAPFSGKWRDLEATFSPDGQYIYFSSDRPITGNAKKDFDIWRAQSPIASASKVTAPTLIMGDVGDPNVPLVNSYEWYHALRDNGVPVEFWAYPVDTHSPHDIVRKTDVYRRWVGWMAQHLK